MEDLIRVPADAFFWALDRLEEAGLESALGFRQLEESGKQIKYERADRGTPPVTHE